MAQKMIKVTLTDGRKFEMPDCKANRDYYERWNRNANTANDRVKIEYLETKEPAKPVVAAPQDADEQIAERMNKTPRGRPAQAQTEVE